MICKKCGQQISDSIDMCPYCGTSQSAGDNSQASGNGYNQNAYAYQQNPYGGQGYAQDYSRQGAYSQQGYAQDYSQQASQQGYAQDYGQQASQQDAYAQGGYSQQRAYSQQSVPQGNAADMSSIRSMYVDSDEREIQVLTQDFASNFFLGRGFTEGCMALTDKRFYARGRGMKGFLLWFRQESIIDLQDVRATRLYHTRRYGLIAWAVIVFFASIITAADAESGAVFFIGLLLVAALVAAYFLTKRTWYAVVTAGYTEKMNVVTFGGIEGMREFDRKLHQAKDAVLQSK